MTFTFIRERRSSLFMYAYVSDKSLNVFWCEFDVFGWGGDTGVVGFETWVLKKSNNNIIIQFIKKNMFLTVGWFLWLCLSGV